MTFNSVYEITNNLSTIAGQHMVEYFSGDSLDSRWTLQDHSGTGTAVMSDTAGARWGGILLRTGGSADANSSLDFDDKRQYEQTNCGFICVARRYDSSTRASWGMTNTSDGTLNFADSVDDTANTNKSLRSADGSTISETEGNIPITATPRSCMKLELSATYINMYIDGVLDVTKTTNRPAAKLQPSFDALTRDSTANGSIIRYCEVYNT